MVWTHWGRKNNNVVKKIGKIREKGNYRGGRLKKKWMEIIRKDKRACRINEDMVRDKEQWRGMIQVAYPIYVG